MSHCGFVNRKNESKPLPPPLSNITEVDTWCDTAFELIIIIIIIIITIRLEGVIMYLTDKAVLNRYVLRLDLKLSTNDEFIISSDNPFHNVGHAIKRCYSAYW